MSETVLNVASRLIAWERERAGVKRPVARERVAKQAGIAPGSLRRLESGTLKFIDRIADRLNDLLVRKIEQRISELEHELALIRATPGRVGSADALAAAAAVEEARRLIGK